MYGAWSVPAVALVLTVACAGPRSQPARAATHSVLSVATPGSAKRCSASTYERPLLAYIPLRQILGPHDFDGALQQMQRVYGGGNINEAELESAFHGWLPVKSEDCSRRLSHFFTEWFDTPYPAGGTLDRPQITGPGLDGTSFYDPSTGCSLPTPQ